MPLITVILKAVEGGLPLKNEKKKAAAVRLIVQISVFFLVFLIAVSKWLAEKGISIPLLPDASLHAICPFGGVVTIYEFVTTGGFIQKIHSSSFVLMILGLIAAVLFGTIFCGYICPFGSYQEWIGKLGKKLFPKKYNKLMPVKIDRILRYLRYLVLIMVLYQTAVSAKLVFQSVDPYYALFNFFTNEVAVSAYIMLGVITVLSLFIERPWCKYLCPYGALLGLFNPIRIFKIRRIKNTCIGCKKCDRVCPMNIEVSGKKIIRDLQCISCHKCTSEVSCPVKDTVVISTGKEGVLSEN
ncbi:putative electron transport protein YccM [bioreactor metagenome]|uniref:Putative electron transport protein YccM n=1 Tax=bioreactor metagenome TaxID=1076179 RepID=A0A644WAN9_9ZZZZ